MNNSCVTHLCSRCGLYTLASINVDCPMCASIKPIVCLPLMRIPAAPEKATKYLPEVWKPNG